MCFTPCAKMGQINFIELELFTPLPPPPQAYNDIKIPSLKIKQYPIYEVFTQK